MSIRRATLVAALLLASCAPAELDPKPAAGVFAGDPGAAEAHAIELTQEWVATSPLLADIDSLEVGRVEIDDLGMAHVRLDQSQAGVPVFGGQAILHLLPSGAVDSITDGLVHDVRADLTPTVDSARGVDVALENHDDVADAVDADLQVLRLDGVDRLTWRVSIDSFDTDTPSRPVVFVDARTGEPLWRYDNLQTARDRRTYDGRNRNGLPGRLERTEGQGPVGDQPVDDAHDHAGITWDYFWAQEGRDSFNGAGATMISTAHHKRNYDNAFWNGTQMVYGDGDVYFYPLSGSLDVVGHELTHAVTEYSADLIYANESGGLNEATSDILGVAVDSWHRGWAVDANTWMLGEDIARPALGAALRFMDNPPADGVSIDHYSDYTPGMDVHYSSGIANKFFYLIATGPDFDIESGAHLWYRALTLYMTPSTTFIEARAATVSAAEDLHGVGSAQVAAVEAAWDAVGVSAPLDYDVIDTQANLSSSTSLSFDYTTAAGTEGIRFAMTGGTGDADLYVRFGAAPTTTTYDCRPYLTGNNETCTFQPSQVGTYHVLINAYSAFSGVTLTVSEAGGPPPPPAEVCDDAIDNDLDGDTDCDDADCALDLACATPEVCDDGLDNDLDGSTDCDDSDCALDAACLPDEVCDDGLDNDLDGDTDCDDSDCALDLACATPEVCDDGVDNDLDGSTDCDDSDCAAAPACQQTCPGGEFTGTLSSSNRDDYVADATGAGLYEGALSGDAGTNFDLHLQYLSGSRWKDRAKSQNGDSNEFVSYNEGSNVQHRWRIRRRSGSGAYTLCLQ